MSKSKQTVKANEKTATLATADAGFRYRLLSTTDGNLRVDPSFNARTGFGMDGDTGVDKKNQGLVALSAQKVAELAVLTKKNGYTPLIGRDMPDGTVFLVAGFRRYAASKVNGEKMLPFMTKVMDDEEAVRWNILENTARKGLDSFEMAMGVAKYVKVMKDKGVSRKGGRAKGDEGAGGWAKPIAANLSMPLSTVKLYIKLLTDLHPQILQAWGDPTSKGHNYCNVTHLLDLSRVGDKAEQLAMFLAEVRDKTVDPAPVDPANPGAVVAPVVQAPRMISYALAQQTLSHFEKATKLGTRAERDAASAYVQAIRFCMGSKPSVGGYDPVKTNEKAKEKAKADAKLVKEQAIAAKAKAKANDDDDDDSDK